MEDLNAMAPVVGGKAMESLDQAERASQVAGGKMEGADAATWRKLRGEGTSYGAANLLYTYCCAQFLVRRERFFALDPRKIARLSHLVDGSIPDMCKRIGPSFEKYEGERLSYC